MLPVHPFVGLFVKTSVRHFFTNRQRCQVAQLINVNCVYIFMMFAIQFCPHVSQEYVEIPLNATRSNIHKTVVSYKTMQSFCSYVAVQNVNVISSPTCKVLCFKKHHHVSPIKCFMLETFPFAVTSSTKLPSSSPLSPPSSSLSSLSSSLLSSSPLSLNPSSPSSSSVLFYISSTSEVRVSPLYLNSSVFFLTTCFLLFIGFRCKVLLTNISIDLLLLALVFLTNFSTFNKQFSKFIMC